MTRVHPYGVLKRFADEHGMPEFVKCAVAVDPTDKSMSADAYADKVDRQLPTHTKAATWLSHLWYMSGAVPARFDSAVRTNLAKAAAYWGIEGECALLEQQLTKKSGTDQHALIIEYPDATICRFPVNSAEEVTKAAADLYEERTKMPYSWRHKAAKVILQRSIELGVPVSPYIEKAAGHGVALPGAVGSSLKIRALMLREPQLREKLAQVAEGLTQLDDIPMDPAQLNKLAHLVDECDRAGRIHGQYTQGLQTPEELCHDLTLSKVAEVVDGSVSLTNGKVISKAALANLQSDAFDLLGDDFVKEIDDGTGKVDIEKAAEVIRTLPMDDANLLLECLGQEKSAGWGDFIQGIFGTDRPSQRELYINASKALRPGQGPNIGEQRWKAMQQLAALRAGGSGDPKGVVTFMSPDARKALVTPQTAAKLSPHGLLGSKEQLDVYIPKEADPVAGAGQLVSDSGKTSYANKVQEAINEGRDLSVPTY